MMLNLTNRMTPHFVLRDLQRWKQYRLEVYATNRKGDSNRIEFENVNMPSILSKSTNSSDIGRCVYVVLTSFILKWLMFVAS